MKRIQGLTLSRVLFAALGISILGVGTAQAQFAMPKFAGKFTLTNQVQWNETVLQPGDYTITIGSMGTLTAVLIRNGKARPVARFLGGIDEGKTSAGDALLIREKRGQLRVYALALASLGKVLVYDPSLARESVMEARAPRMVPVTLAKR